MHSRNDACVHVCFNYTLQYDLIFWAMVEFMEYWVPIVILRVVSILFKRIVVYKIITKRMKWEGWKRDEAGEFLLQRGWFHHYDLFMLIVRLATGFVTALVRFIITVGVALVTLTRANVSPLPAWIERYTLLDTGSKSFQAVLKVNHRFNNPIFRVACWVLMEDSARRRELTAAASATDAADDGKQIKDASDVPGDLVSVEQLCGQIKLFEEEEGANNVETKKTDAPDTTEETQKKVDVAEDTQVTVKTRRHSGLGVLRWRLAIMLHHYPQLRYYRAHYLAREDAKKPHSWKQGPARDPEMPTTDRTPLPALSDPTSSVATTTERSMAELAHRLLQGVGQRLCNPRCRRVYT